MMGFDPLKAEFLCLNKRKRKKYFTKEKGKKNIRNTEINSAKFAWDLLLIVGDIANKRT